MKSLEIKPKSNPNYSQSWGEKKQTKMKYFIRRVLFKVSLNKGLFKVAAVTKPVGDCTEPADPTRGGAGGEESCGIPGEARWFPSVVLQTKYHKRDQDV